MSMLIQQALDLHEAHLQQWMPRTVSYHRYWTRAEKKRVYAAIQERDVAFMKKYLDGASEARSKIENVTNCIIFLTYLSKATYLFQNAKFRNTIWNKMVEFEATAYRETQRINALEHRETYESQVEMLEHWHDLLITIWHVRDILRK